MVSSCIIGVTGSEIPFFDAGKRYEILLLTVIFDLCHDIYHLSTNKAYMLHRVYCDELLLIIFYHLTGNRLNLLGCHGAAMRQPAIQVHQQEDYNVEGTKNIAGLLVESCSTRSLK